MKRLLLLAVPVALAAAWFVLNPPAPSLADGEEWTNQLLDRTLGPAFVEARGPATAAALQDLIPLRVSGEGCITRWYYHTRFARVIETSELSIIRRRGDPCDPEAALDTLNVSLRPSAGVTPGGFVAQLTRRFGKPGVSHSRGVGGAPKPETSYTWYPTPGLSVSLLTGDYLGRGDTFFYSLSRDPGRAAVLPPPAEAERWMDGFVATVTGPLMDADASTAPALLGGMVPRGSVGGSRCNVAWESPAPPPAYLTNANLILEEPGDGSCEHATFGTLAVSIFQSAPVSTEAFVTRLTARFGTPEINHNSTDNSTVYSWQSGPFISVLLMERLKGATNPHVTLSVTRVPARPR